jgi:hypothetical protein
MANTNFILNGITRDCNSENDAIGVDKDLILIDYKYLNLEATKSSLNRQSDNTFNNYKGLTDIKLKTGAVLNIFEGAGYSVIPSVTPEVREDGTLWYNHSITFTVFSKLSKDRETLMTLGRSKVLAVVKDLSTGLYEVFGLEQGLKVSGMERSYVGSANSNFYSVTIATPPMYVIKESTLGELVVNLGGIIEATPQPIDPDFQLLLNRAITIRFEQKWLGGSQGFLLPFEYSNIEGVYVNGQGLSVLQFELTTSNSVTILENLHLNDFIIINYNKI